MSSEALLDTDKKESTLSRFLKLFLKIVITAVCFWYISTKIDFGDALQALLNANWLYLFIALILFLLSKLFSSFRLNIYFRNIGVHLSETKNIRLYLLGMFYNLFLPGAISGDAYKVILLRRKYQVSYKKLSSAILLDRFSGVIALGIILCIYGLMVLDQPFMDFILAAGAILVFLSFYLATRFIFPYLLPGFFPTFFWGLAVQGMQVICIYFILLSLHVPLQAEWIFIFLVAAVISILPISLGGGLATRELVFAEAAQYFHLDPQTGVVISLLFYLLTVAGSLPGLYFVFRDPLR